MIQPSLGYQDLQKVPLRLILLRHPRKVKSTTKQIAKCCEEVKVCIVEKIVQESLMIYLWTYRHLIGGGQLTVETNVETDRFRWP